MQKLLFSLLFHRLRVRIKALQQTIDTQSVRITDLISSQVLASMDGMIDIIFGCLSFGAFTTSDQQKLIHLRGDLVSKETVCCVGGKWNTEIDYQPQGR